MCSCNNNGPSGLGAEELRKAVPKHAPHPRALASLPAFGQRMLGPYGRPTQVLCTAVSGTTQSPFQIVPGTVLPQLVE